MKIAILGYGAQGRSAYEYWRDGNEISVCDGNKELVLPTGVNSQLGPDHLQGLDRFDLIVRSPIVHPRDIVAANSPAILEKVTSNTNEFFQVSPSCHIIGVTGTKGKGTTSTLITKILEAAGKRVHLGGNIGTPPLDLLKDTIHSDDWVVLELANFQLIDLQYSPPIAVCLMVAPEHQDWHNSVDEYFAAKAQLFAHQQADNVAIYYSLNPNSQAIAAHGFGQKLPYYAAPGAIVANDSISIAGRTICKTAELKLLGKHNWQNVCAAVTAVWQITQDVAAIRSVLTSFEGLPYRIELRREVQGISYYNDSFATGPPASLAAMAAIPGKKIMIFGGHDRGLNLNELAEAVAADQNIGKVLLIGASAQRLADCLDEHGFTNYTLSSARDMPTVVQQATKLASSGDAVVFSPGFASFDMFKNFEERGRQFNAAVEAL